MLDNEPINLLKPKTEHFASAPLPETAPRKRSFLLSPAFRLFLFGLAIFGVGVFLLTASIARTAPADDGSSLSLFASLERLVGAKEKAIAGENDDRINVLLLGIGGTGHDGPELTDTMILSSFKPSTKELGLISMPRDLDVNIPGYGYGKINAVNAYAEQAKKGSGPEAAAAIMSNIFDQPIPFTIKVDFNGFSELIDVIGGIDVYVERDFTDPKYPIDDAAGNVKTLTFTQGWTHMDGALTLEYSRSRHGNNGEGSDFARATRQQKVLLAVKDRALSIGVLLNPAKLSKILATVQKNVKTNISAWEMMKLAEYVPQISAEKTAMHILDSSSGLVYQAYINNTYLLLPYKTNWDDFKTLALNIFTPDSNKAPLVLTNNSSPDAEKVIIEIQNGTKTGGLAGETAQLLESSGFAVASISNAATQDFKKTIIYDLTQGQKQVELAALKEYLRADVYMTKSGYLTSSAVTPDQIVDDEVMKELVTAEVKIDFLVILGQDSTTLVMR